MPDHINHMYQSKKAKNEILYACNIHQTLQHETSPNHL